MKEAAKTQTLQTDASYPDLNEELINDNQAYAVERAAKLIQEVAGGVVSNELVDIHPTGHSKKGYYSGKLI